VNGKQSVVIWCPPSLPYHSYDFSPIVGLRGEGDSSRQLIKGFQENSDRVNETALISFNVRATFGALRAEIGKHVW
jgi:hypothetical protein